MRNGDLGRGTNFSNDAKSTPKKVRAKSTKKQKIWLIIWIILFALICFEVVKLVRYTLGKENKEKMWLYNSVDSVIQKVIKRKSGSVDEKSLTMAALGDIYLSPNMLKGATTSNGYDFSSGTDLVKDVLAKYDLVTASLSTPIAGKAAGYSTTKNYNAPEELLSTLKDLNVKVLTTATVNAMDKSTNGITTTVENIKKAGLEQTGLGGSERTKPVIFNKNDITIGILSYATKSTVKIAKGNENYLNLLDDENLKQDIAYLKENKVDFIVTYVNTPNTDADIIVANQKDSVEQLIQAGVDVILCTGVPGVQEDYEEEVTLKDETKNHVYSIYALGEFFGGNTTNAAKSSIIANIEFTKTITKNKNGEITKTQNDMKIKEPVALWASVDKSYKKTMYVMSSEIEKYNNSKSNLDVKEYSAMKEEYDKILTMFK
ncbi:MAG: CapA family protein [Clostridia bacterium]|nr:CapA family protein [Clostridia bacterium]